MARVILVGSSLFVILAASAVSAQLSSTFVSCMSNARPQAAMTECAGQEAKRAQAEVDKAYADLIKNAGASSVPGAVSKIQTAEAAWNAYRAAYLEARFPAEDKQLEYGSMYPMDADILLAEMTREHAAILREMGRGAKTDLPDVVDIPAATLKWARIAEQTASREKRFEPTGYVVSVSAPVGDPVVLCTVGRPISTTQFGGSYFEVRIDRATDKVLG